MALQKDTLPEQYIKGFAEFYGYKFIVTPDVLIPRFETEKIVDEVKTFATTNNLTNDNLHIVDVGTGSGCIAITLAKQLKNVKIIATDASRAALDIGQKNAIYHRVTDKVAFIHCDLVTDVTTGPDIIVTNLPYIPSERMKKLDSSVKDHEPHLALDGGRDGFEFYRKLWQQIADKKWQPKFIIGEIDETQGQLALTETQKYFLHANVNIVKDVFGYDRFIAIT